MSRAPEQASAQPTNEQRTTAFQAAEGSGVETISGGTLLIAAYACIWVILFVWIARVFARQSSTERRLRQLERLVEGSPGAPSPGGSPIATSRREHVG